MSYLTKRVLNLRSVLDKKSELEQAVNDIKSKAEFEQNNLDRIKSELQEVGSKIEEANGQLTEITSGSLRLAEDVQKFIQGSVSVFDEATDVISLYEQAIRGLGEEVDKQTKLLEKTREDILSQIKNLESQTAFMERKRADIGIYEARLRKKIKDAGLEEGIKLTFV